MNAHWIYKLSDPNKWTVGFYDPEGKWIIESEHASPGGAAERVALLNGRRPVTFDTMRLRAYRALVEQMVAEKHPFADMVDAIFAEVLRMRGALGFEALEEMGPNDRRFLNRAANWVSSVLPDGWGFILLAAELNSHEGGRLAYTANIKREDAVEILTQWLARAGTEKGWMQHLNETREQWKERVQQEFHLLQEASRLGTYDSDQWAELWQKVEQVL